MRRPSKVRRWLEDLRKQAGLIGLEVVLEERSADPGTFLSVPWNLVYDERPAKYKPAFQRGKGRALAAVLVDPLQPDQRAACRAPEAVADLDRPRVIVVVDPTVYETSTKSRSGIWTSSSPRRA